MSSDSTQNCCCCVCVPYKGVAMIERFGDYQDSFKPGCHFLWPCIDSVAGTVTTKLQELRLSIETKTKDNVFVTLAVAVQYQIEDEDASSAFYRMTDPKTQLRSNIEHILRGEVPKMDLDRLFEEKENIAEAVSDALKGAMKEYGYHIQRTLVTDIEPDAKVKAAMNEINAAERERVAAAAKAEANYITLVKSAEAEAKSKELQGIGIAAQRRAIVSGLKESVHDFADGVPGATAKDALDMVALTQYFDTLKEIGSSSGSRAIFIPSGVGVPQSMREEMRTGMMQALASEKPASQTMS